MRRLFYLWSFVMPSALIAQSLTQNDFADIVKVAYEANKLPRELTTPLAFRDTVVVIVSYPMAESKKELDQTLVKPKVMFWTDEEIFLYSPLYWMTPTKARRRANRAFINYKTTTGNFRRPGIDNKCYEGEIRAKREGERWVILGSKFSPVDCKFEPPVSKK